MLVKGMVMYSFTVQLVNMCMNLRAGLKSLDNWKWKPNYKLEAVGFWLVFCILCLKLYVYSWMRVERHPLQNYK